MICGDPRKRIAVGQIVNEDHPRASQSLHHFSDFNPPRLTNRIVIQAACILEDTTAARNFEILACWYLWRIKGESEISKVYTREWLSIVGEV